MGSLGWSLSNNSSRSTASLVLPLFEQLDDRVDPRSPRLPGHRHFVGGDGDGLDHAAEQAELLAQELRHGILESGSAGGPGILRQQAAVEIGQLELEDTAFGSWHCFRPCYGAM